MRKYLLSGHPVFLLRVDLKSDQIRWLDQTARFKRTVETLDFLRRVSQVCRSIASVARYRSSDKPDATQCKGFTRLCPDAATQQPVVRLKNFTFVVNPTTEGRSALSSGAIYPVVLTSHCGHQPPVDGTPRSRRARWDRHPRGRWRDPLIRRERVQNRSAHSAGP